MRFTRLTLIVAMVFLWCVPAMAQEPIPPEHMYQVMQDDFGFYPPEGTQDCTPFGSIESIPGFCFQPNFLPVARLSRAADGTLNMQGDGDLLAEVDFATDWAGNAVSPHRSYQVESFTKYEDPELGTMIPFCQWIYSDFHSGGTGVYAWNLGCSETRPAGYESTSLQCETEPFMADFNDGNGMVEVPFSVCDDAGIMYVPALPTPPPPAGIVMVENDDVWFDNMFDLRSIDATHPNFGMLGSVGGWSVGISIHNQGIASQVSRVEIISVGGAIEQNIVLTTPDVFVFLGMTLDMYGMWFGNSHQLAPQYDVFAYDLNDKIIQFQGNNGIVNNNWTIYPDKNIAVPPVTQLRKMVITKSNGIRVKFTAPFDPRDGEIRIRIQDEDGNFIQQFNASNLDGLSKDADGHYYFVTNKGEVILDKVKIFIPIEYAGHTARIEYRVYDSPTVLRGVTYFQLPAPEPVVVEEP